MNPHFPPPPRPGARAPRRELRSVAGLALIAALAAPVGASGPAAASPRPDGADVKLFRPSAGASDYLHLSGGFLLRPIGLTASLVLDTADAPLTEVRQGFEPTRPVLSHQTHLTAGLALSLADWFEVGLSMPLALSQGAGSAYGELVPGAGAPGFAAGDLRITPKLVLVNVDNAFALAIGTELALPTGSSFTGYGAVSGGGQLILDFQPAYYVRLTLNAGARLREDAEVGSLRLGHSFTWGAGFQFNVRIEEQLFSILGSISGEVPFSYRNDDNDPFEFLGGLGWRGVENLNIFAAAGAGLNRGYGAPDFRAVFGVRWGDYRECLDGPEDLDGWEDEDGCAELDNDADGLHDIADACPNEAETRNGWEDGDGCPDTRPSGLVDLAVLELRAEGGQDALAGRDSDGDGVSDAEDLCPTEPEDLDGFADSDGCPELDNDEDGVADAKDKCPLQAETVNDFDDHDGCPDSVPDGLKVRVSDRERTLIISDRVHFAPGTARIEKRSFELLEAIAQILESRTDISKMRIEGHTDNIGAAAYNLKLSADRAESVKAWLVERGIAASRLETRGAGLAEPIADNRTAAGRAENRRVEFEILEYTDAP